MDLLEKLPVDAHEDNDTGVNWNDQHTEVQLRVSIVDAMAEVQCLDKPGWVKNCSHLADHFTNRCLLYTSPSPRDLSTSRMPSSA